MELPVTEQALIFISHILSLVLVVYVAKKVSIKLALLFLLSFAMIYQQFYMVYFMTVEDRSEGIGECWVTLQDYYACMPLSERLSIHAAQVGAILSVTSTFILAKRAAVKE